MILADATRTATTRYSIVRPVSRTSDYRFVTVSLEYSLVICCSDATYTLCSRSCKVLWAGRIWANGRRMRNVHPTNDQRIHSVLMYPLASAQNFEHVQNLNVALAHLCEFLRINNVNNVRPTCHERLATYANVSNTLGVRWWDTFIVTIALTLSAQISPRNSTVFERICRLLRILAYAKHSLGR